MASLLQNLKGIGAVGESPLHLRGDFGGRTPNSLLSAMAGMTDPQVSAWLHLGVALARENTDTSGNAQGATTDGDFWYVGSNTNDGSHR